MSDWGGTYDRVMGVKMGLDPEMPGPEINMQSSAELIVEAVNEKELNESLVDRDVERVLHVVFKVQEVVTRRWLKLRRIASYFSKMKMVFYLFIQKVSTFCLSAVSQVLHTSRAPDRPASIRSSAAMKYSRRRATKPSQFRTLKLSILIKATF